jgi:glycosyltransferase involved in cell wall biosynthesis
MEYEPAKGPVVSVVMPVRNGRPWIQDQLDALSLQICDVAWDVVVADNGSTDGTRQLLEEWVIQDSRFSVVDASAGPGPSRARNVGAAHASSSLLAFCDADDVVQPGWLQACVRALQGADAAAGTFDFSLLSTGRRSPPVVAATAQLAFLPAALGANFCVRRDAFESVGGFAEELAVGEDIDLSWRLQLAGYHLATATDAVVAKRDRGTPTAVFRAAWTYGRGDPVLHRRFRISGMGRDLRGAAREWTWLVVALPSLALRSGRIRWCRTFGVRSGRLAGSIRYWSFFP